MIAGSVGRGPGANHAGGSQTSSSRWAKPLAVSGIVTLTTAPVGVRRADHRRERGGVDLIGQRARAVTSAQPSCTVVT